jgi:hypothetical protein
MRSPLPRSALAIALAVSCGDPATGTVSLVTGEESDALSREPVPSTLVVELVGLDRLAKEVARVPMSSGTLGLGQVSKSDIGAIRVTALDPSGTPLVRGESLYLQFGALERGALEIFVQRTGELARPPETPRDIGEAPVTALVLARYVVSAHDTTASIYDLLTLRTSSSIPVFPRPARSLASSGATLVVIDEEGASTFDLSSGATTELPAPLGGSFAEVSGGRTILAADGSEYVVGATRLAGGASTRVLRISAEGDVTFASLSAAREGACAAWVPNRGLLVWGGSDTAAGAEVLAPGATQGAALAFEADPVRGCGATALDENRLLVVGGDDAPARVVDLACASGCAPEAWPDPLPVGRADAMALGAEAALVVGEDASGATRVLRASAQGVREIELRVPRRSARLVALPTGAGAVVGGGEGPGLEQYVE